MAMLVLTPGWSAAAAVGPDGVDVELAFAAETGEVTLSWQGDQPVFEVFRSVDPATIVYGLDCFYAQLGDATRAVEMFERALAAGFAHASWIDRDGDLDPIRSDSRFVRARATLARET